MSMKTNESHENRGPAGVADPEFGSIDVGVIGVAGTRKTKHSDLSAWSAMEDYAALASDRAPVRVLRLPLSQADVHTVASRVADLRSRVSAVFIVGLGPSSSASVQRIVASLGGPVVITELDVVTAAVAAAAIRALRDRDISPRRGRITVTHPELAPRLGPLLLASGSGSVTSWHERDALAYPLRHVMARNDILIDLAGTAPKRAAPGRTLTLPTELFDYGCLVLPGLLSALCRHKVATLSIEVLSACAQALALVTPAERMLPELDERLLVPAVARHVTRALDEHTEQRRHQHW
jgi:hypothetical protein